MFEGSQAFSGFSVDDVEKAREFYGDVLGLNVKVENGMLELNLATGAKVIAYPKPNHEPATFTILNFPVEDIDKAIGELRAKGITFERYEGMPQDDKGIMHGKQAGMGPDIAWFKDPAGNILAVLEV